MVKIFGIFLTADAPMDWIAVGIQAGGAIAVCGMFLWFLKHKQIQDDKARSEFLAHLQSKDALSQEAIKQQMEYLRDRDAQSKEIAQTGHAALQEVSKQVERLHEHLKRD